MFPLQWHSEWEEGGEPREAAHHTTKQMPEICVG